MTRIIQLALAALCVGLLLIIAAQLFQMRSQDVPLSLKPAAATTAVEARVPPLAVEAAVAEILERPLFSPARQPLEVLSVSNAGENSGDAPPRLHGRLAGVMIRPGAREALFARVGQRPIAVKVGGEVDGWKIAAIEPDRVILSSAFGIQTVRPTNDPEVVRPRARTTETALGVGMGPPTSSTTRGAAAPAPSTRPPPQSSKVEQ